MDIIVIYKAVCGLWKDNNIVFFFQVQIHSLPGLDNLKCFKAFPN